MLRRLAVHTTKMGHYVPSTWHPDPMRSWPAASFWAERLLQSAAAPPTPATTTGQQERQSEGTAADSGQPSCSDGGSHTRASTEGVSSRVLSVQTAAEPSTSASAAAVASQAQTQDRQLALFFTCNKCDTRALKSFSKHSYERGVVLVRCPGCQGLHLIADHLGWFGDSGTIEDFLASNGEEVRWKDMGGTLELTPEDVLGQSKLDML